MNMSKDRMKARKVEKSPKPRAMTERRQREWANALVKDFMNRRRNFGCTCAASGTCNGCRQAMLLALIDATDDMGTFDIRVEQQKIVTRAEGTKIPTPLGHGAMLSGHQKTL